MRCPICLKQVMSPINPNNCRHIFCKYCLKKWLSIKKSCPMCRKNVDFYSKVDLTDKNLQSQLDEFIIDSPYD